MQAAPPRTICDYPGQIGRSNRRSISQHVLASGRDKKSHVERLLTRIYDARTGSVLAIQPQFAHGCAITTHAHTMFRTLIAICLLACTGSAAWAEGTVPPEFVACSRVQINGERLACYDRAVAYLSAPTGQQSPAPSPEASFGLQASVPQPAAAARVDESKSDDVSAITAHVTEVTSDREGKKLVTLDNGQTWRELSKSAFVALKAGDEVTINRAALGSFLMSPPNGRPFRVRRVK